MIGFDFVSNVRAFIESEELFQRSSSVHDAPDVSSSGRSRETCMRHRAVRPFRTEHMDCGFGCDECDDHNGVGVAFELEEDVSSSAQVQCGGYQLSMRLAPFSLASMGPSKGREPQI